MNEPAVSTTTSSQTLLAIADQLREQAAHLEREAFLYSNAKVPPVSSVDRRDVLNSDLDPGATEAELLGRDYGDGGGNATARRSVLAARLGRAEDALMMAAQAEASSGVTRETIVMIALSRALVSLAEGRPAESYDGLLSVIADGRDVGEDLDLALLMGVFAESGIRARRPNEAQYVVDEWLSRTGVDAADPKNTEVFVATALLHISGSQTFGLVIPAGDALTALAVARLQLAAGMWLRRNRRIVEARSYLTAAGVAFARAGGQPWQMLCESELAASSVTHGSSSPTELLSPQQLVVARLVARGLSNQEIASQLCLSPRTVSSHLYRIFPTLGISSRSQLVAALLMNELSAA